MRPGAGTVLEGHRLVRAIGRGGMGEVWEAEHLPTGARRAVKLLARQAGEGMRARFQREAEAQARVSHHPHVGKVHAYGTTPDGEGWLAMDLLPGGTLAKRVEAGPLPPEEVAAIGAKLARALAHVHGLGVLHRDVKPGNVLLDEHGEPVLVDFGLARLTEGDRLTQSDMVLGTPSHAAPEQLEAAHAVGPPADVYGLGALLYQLLTGEAPFRGGNVAMVIHAVLSKPPRPPRELVPAIPPALEALVLQCLEKDPADRPAGATELAEELDAWLAGEAPIPLGRDPGVRFLAAVIAALAVGATALALLRSSDRPTRAAEPGAPAEQADPEVASEETAAGGPLSWIDVAVLSTAGSAVKNEELDPVGRKRLEIRATEDAASLLTELPRLLSDPSGGTPEPVEDGPRPFPVELLRKALETGDPNTWLDLALDIEKHHPDLRGYAGWIFREQAREPNPPVEAVSGWGLHLAELKDSVLPREGLSLLERAAARPDAPWRVRRRLAEALLERPLVLDSPYERVARARRLLEPEVVVRENPEAVPWLALALSLPDRERPPERQPEEEGPEVREAIRLLDAHETRVGVERLETRFRRLRVSTLLDWRAGQALDLERALPHLDHLVAREDGALLSLLETHADRGTLPPVLADRLARPLQRIVERGEVPRARLAAVLILATWQRANVLALDEPVLSGWLRTVQGADPGLVARWHAEGKLPGR